jgi:hypothetical protein
MENGLARPGSTVNDYPESILRNTLIPGQMIGRSKNITDKSFVFLLQVKERRYVFARHDQEMNRRLRIDVLKSHNGVILIDNVSFDLAFNDAAKKTVAHRTHLPITEFRLNRYPQGRRPQFPFR